MSNLMFKRFLFYICLFTSITNSIICTKKTDASDFILIENDFVTCYSDRLVIHLYYFPFGDKIINYNNIHSCELLRANDLSFYQTKCWGMAWLPVWWHLDIRRSWREYYLILDANQWPKIGITMDDNDIIKVYDLIKQKMALTSLEKTSDQENNNSVESISDRTL